MPSSDAAEQPQAHDASWQGDQDPLLHPVDQTSQQSLLCLKEALDRAFPSQIAEIFRPKAPARNPRYVTAMCVDGLPGNGT